MKKIVVLCILCVSALGFSQNQGMLRGTVLDEEMLNEPLLFANVQLKGADQETQTNFHGNFEFDHLKSGAYTLVISYAGYQNIEMPIMIKADQTIQLQLGMAAKRISLEGIVGIGIARSSEEDETHSITEPLQRK